MTIPGASVSVGEDADVLPPSAAQIHCKVGYCSAGAANVPQSHTDSGAMATALGAGPLVDAAALAIAARTSGQPAPGPVVLVPTAATAGSASSVTPGGSNTGNATLAVTGNPTDDFSVQVLVTRTTNGASLAPLGQALARVSLDGGRTFGPETLVSAAGDLPAPRTGLTLTFTAGSPTSSALGVGDTFAFTTQGPQSSLTQVQAAVAGFLASPLDAEFVHVVGAPPPTMSGIVQSGTGPAVTLTGTPSKHVMVVIEITTGGIRGTAVFKWSIDGGASFVATGVSTAATVTLTGTGLTANFPTGTYVANETYFSHSAAALAAWAAGLDSTLSDAEGGGRFLFAILEAPDLYALNAGNATTRAVADVALADASSGISTRRVLLCGGSARHTFPNVLRQDLRNIGRAVAARLASTRPAVHPGQVDLGAVQGVVATDTDALPRDEGKTPGLDAARYTTLRRFRGRPGAYVTRGRTSIAAPSQYEGVQVVRVVHAAARIAWFEAFNFLNKPWRTNPDATLDELGAQVIEGRIRTAILSELPAGGENPALSDALFAVDRSEPIGTSHKIKGKVRVRPLGYSEYIEIDVAAAAITQ